MKKLSEVLGVGKLVGSRGASFRKTSTSKPDDWKDHSGKDVGAMRNFAHEKAAVAKAAASKSERESIVNKRNKDAAQRAKETLRMAKEGLDEAKGKFVYDKPLKANVAAMDKHSTDALKGMHDRWSSDHKDMKSNPSHSERLLATHHVLKNRGVSVPDLPQHKNLGMVKRFTAESTESAGTEARVKIKNVARPDDAAPTSEKSLLSRNGEIKVKKVDEEIAASISRKYGLSDSVLEAARAVMEKKTQVDLDPTTDDKEDNGDNDDDDDVKKESKHTTPKSGKEKKLAALAHPKDKITHKDVLVGRGVLKKEEVEIDETKLSYDDFTKGARRAGSGSTDELIASLKKKRSGPGSGTVRKLDKAELKRRSTTAKEETEIEEKTLYGNPAELKRQLDQLSKREKALPPGISPARKALAIQKQKLQKAHSAAMGMKKEDVDIDSLTEEQLEEVLKKSDPAGKWVSDFVHSKDPKFAGKSKKERMKMALGAYYGKQRNEEVELTNEEIERLEAIAAQLDEAAVTVDKLKSQGWKKTHSSDGGWVHHYSHPKKEHGYEVEYGPAPDTVKSIKKSQKMDEGAKPTIVSAPIRGANQDQSGFGVKNNTADYTISDSKKVKVKEEAELEEGRGRPKKSGEAPEGDDTGKHPIQQLHKIASGIEGSEPHFEHKDGSKTKVSKQLAKHITAVYGSMRTTQEKDDFANKLHANRQSMMTAVDKHVR